MRTIVVGCNHRTAPIELRERLAFDDTSCLAALSAVGLRYPCCETAILSTCNRTELYVARPNHGRPRIQEAIEVLADISSVPLHEISQALYHFVDSQAVRHLFKVTSSLDSMVVGESQILGQAKKALDLAQRSRTIGKSLTTLFQRSFAVAKEVHSATGIAEGKVSIGSTAVDFARQIFAGFEDKTVLMIGAGKMGELTLRHVRETQPKRILVTNRTLEKAEAVAKTVDGTARPFSDLLDLLVEADIVISSTGSSEPILTRADIEQAMVRRRYRPMILLDLAVPRDIDGAAASLGQVFLYNVDDLQQIIDTTHQQRQTQVAQAERIVEEAVREYSVWQDRRGIGPVVRALDSRLTEIGEGELEWLRHKLSDLEPAEEELIRQMVHRMTRKILHSPVEALNKNARNGEAKVYAETLKTLFKLPDEA